MIRKRKKKQRRRSLMIKRNAESLYFFPNPRSQSILKRTKRKSLNLHLLKLISHKKMMRMTVIFNLKKFQTLMKMRIMTQKIIIKGVMRTTSMKFKAKMLYMIVKTTLLITIQIMTFRSIQMLYLAIRVKVSLIITVNSKR